MVDQTDRKADLFDFEQTPDLTWLRELLERNEFTPAAIQPLTQLLALNKGPLTLPKALRWTNGAEAFRTCCRLFILAQPVARADLEAFIPADRLEQLTVLGLLREDARGLRSIAHLRPVDDLYILSDFEPLITNHGLLPAHVLGVGQAPRTLASLTVRNEVDAVLDLGTGSGYQALLAARHARQVLGTDVNPRALAFAEFNRRLNGIENLDLRNGSFFEPLDQRTFDLIVCNPPYLITPGSSIICQETEMDGDQVSEYVVKGVADHLAENGFAMVMANWHHQDAQNWREKPHAWAAATGCDAWVMQIDQGTAFDYAESWICAEGLGGPNEYETRLDEWLVYFKQKQIDHISAGVFILRRCSGREPWLRLDTVQRGAQSCGHQIQRIFKNETLMHTADNPDILLDTRYKTANEILSEYSLYLREGQWRQNVQRLRLANGFKFSGNTDEMIMTLLAYCNGNLPLRDLLKGVAEQFHQDPDALREPVLDIMKSLMRSGFVEAMA